MNKTIFIFPLLFLLTSFAYREPIYCKIVDSITKNYLKEFAEPRGLKLSGYGGAMMDDIKEITLSFSSSKALNLDEARKLYVEMMEGFLLCINAHERIRPYLHNFPFGVSNIKLDIDFVDSQGHTTNDGHVAMIFISKNETIHYDAYNPHTREFYTLNKEPYKEAYRIATGH